MSDLSLALLAGHSALFGWTDDGRFECTDDWLGQLGLTRDELTGSFADFSRRLHPDDVAHFEVRWRAMLEARRNEPFECEYRLEHRSGEHRWFRAMVEIDQTAKTARAAQVDVHALKTAEARLLTFNVELARVVSAREDFLSSMSHELRTPLNAVLGQAQAMTEGTFGPLTPPMRDALDVISASGHHLLSLLNTVLDLARLEAGAMPLHREHVGVVAVCQEAIHVVRPQAAAKGVDLDFSWLKCSADDLATFDRLRVRQVLVNLLSNAVKFSRTGATVRFELGRDDDSWVFEVSDTGPGIDPLDQRRLFHAFVRAENGLSRRTEGVGLGLALVKRLVDLHGGSIALNSALGHGSRFTVRLPVSLDSPTQTQAPKLQSLYSAMIVDDTIINVEPLRRYLLRLGAEVRTAEGGVEALRLVETRAPQVMFLDWHMPGMDGQEVIRKLRDAPWSRGVKIVVLTALAGDHVRHEALAAGADAFLTKPARLAEAAALADVLARGSGVITPP